MTTTESPASQLREAAALLREHVDAATPGRWHHMCLGSEGCQVLNDGHLRERKHVARFGRKEWKADHADAEFVALMDPVVAGALADWLDDVATDADEMLKLDTPECAHDGGDCYCKPMAPEWGCDKCGEYLAPGACRCWDKARAVARAILGRDVLPEPWECPNCHCLFERAGMDHEPCRVQQGETS